MTLKQMSRIKRWLLLHGNRHPVELQAWDLVLTSWVLGLMAVPVLLLTDALVLLPLSLAGFLLPTAYAAVRGRLHRRGRLRCDWLALL